MVKVVKWGQEWSKWSSGVKSGQVGSRVVKVVKRGHEWSSGVKSGQSGQVGSRVIKWGLEWSIEWSRGSRVVSDYLKKKY